MGCRYVKFGMKIVGDVRHGVSAVLNMTAARNFGVMSKRFNTKSLLNKFLVNNIADNSVACRPVARQRPRNKQLDNGP
jgi:hypothetical protein